MADDPVEIIFDLLKQFKDAGPTPGPGLYRKLLEGVLKKPNISPNLREMAQRRLNEISN